MSRVNIVKRIKIGGRWKMFSIPRNAKGNYDWNAIADGRYYVEWYVGGTRRRVSAGVTAAQALEVQGRKHHEPEGRKLGIPGFETAGETVKKPALHIAITKYLDRSKRRKSPTPTANMKPCSTASVSSSATAGPDQPPLTYSAMRLK